MAAAIMRAVRLDEVGPPENLKIVEKPVPQVGPDDVLIKVDAAGLIFGDTEARRGTYFSPTILPFFPGREAGGYVAAVGADVTQWKPGDRVLALALTLGCCAEYVLVSTKPRALPSGSMAPPADMHLLPEKIPFETGLVYLVNFRLAHMLFHGSSKVAAGETVFIQGAAGGMGSMMTQIAHAHGCPVIATCLHTVEEDFLRLIGADHVINVSKEDYVPRVLEITDGKGVGYSFNGVGGDTLQKDTAVLRPFGEIQAYGYVAGKKLFDVFNSPRCIAVKSYSADTFFPTPMFPAANKAMYEWFESGPLLAPGTVLPLDQVAEANRILDKGEALGKVVLKI